MRVHCINIGIYELLVGVILCSKKCFTKIEKHDKYNQKTRFKRVSKGQSLTKTNKLDKGNYCFETIKAETEL